MQLPFTAFLPQSSWTPPAVSSLPVWTDAKRVAIDCETKDPNLKELGIGVRRPDGCLAGVSFAFEDGPGFYLPFGHEGEGNLDKQHCIQYLKDQAKNFKGVLGGANLGYDLDWLAEDGVIFKPSKFRCCQVTEPLLNEHRLRYGLGHLARNVYGIPGKDESLLREAASLFGIHPKKELYKLPPQFVGAYAEQDAHLPLRILRKQEKLIDEENLWDIYELESELIPILVKMRRRGVLVDQKRLEKVTTYLLSQQQKMCDEINRNSMVKISPSDLKKEARLGPFVRSLGFAPEKTATGKDSITKEWLASLSHPVMDMLNEARAFSTMTSFAEGLPRYITKDSRVHPTFNQLKADKDEDDNSKSKAKKTKGTISGRLSSDKPNAQQQPVRMGPLWRAIYRPDPGKFWVSGDFSAQEPRLTVHYGEILGLPGAKESGDRFRNNPKEDAYAFMVEATGLSRKVVKAVVLGVSYSMGEGKFCDSLGLPTEIKMIQGKYRRVAGPEGKKILTQFNAAVPYIRLLSKRTMAKAESTGVIRTLLNRHLHFPTDDLGNFLDTHKALNKLIQGGSADQMKKAMILADRAGIKMQLQVHDELDFSAKTEAEANQLAEIMRDAVKLLVPSKVDLECGPSWGEINDEGRIKCKEFYGD